jgi:drug/metabolite transporter (DMT)-like permease
MAAALALLASILWGFADFLGGAFSRRLHTAYVMLWSSLAGLLACAAILALGGWRTPGAYLWWGVAASVFGTSAAAFFYRALAIGTMSVVAPIAGTGLVVPVVAGLLLGERPSALQLAGIALAAAGVVLASGPEMRGIGDQRLAVGYAVLAAIGFGGALALMPRAGPGRWAMTSTAVVVTAIAGVAAYVLARPPPGPLLPRRDAAGVVAIGVLNVGAISLYSYAAGRGLVAVVAVLASLYSVVTVVLAQVVYGERLRGVQLGGVLVAFGGVVCLAAG